MSVFAIKATVLNLTDPARRLSTELLVDAGAVYSMLPRSVLVSLGISPRSQRRFRCPSLLGAVTLEAMGVAVDPINKQLIPVEGLLAPPQ